MFGRVLTYLIAAFISGMALIILVGISREISGADPLGYERVLPDLIGMSLMVLVLASPLNLLADLLREKAFKGTGLMAYLGSRLAVFVGAGILWFGFIATIQGNMFPNGGSYFWEGFGGSLPTLLACSVVWSLVFWMRREKIEQTEVSA